MTHLPLIKCWRCLLQDAERDGPEAWACTLKRALEIAIQIIETHNMCHDLHGKVDAKGFAAGCAHEQRAHFGCAPDADANIVLREAAQMALDFIWGEEKYSAQEATRRLVLLRDKLRQGLG